MTFRFKKFYIYYILILINSKDIFSHEISHEKLYKLRLFNFDEHASSNLSIGCYTAKDLIKRTLETGMDSREEIQKLFQARQAVKIKLGQLLPQIDMHSIASSAADGGISLDTVVPFVGFLFPNRWIEWNSSKIILLAERESLATLSANRAQAVLDLYYNIQMQIWSTSILDFYIQEIDSLLYYFDQESSKYRRIDAENRAVLENVK